MSLSLLSSFAVIRHDDQGKLKSLFGAYSFRELDSMTIMADRQAGFRAVGESLHLCL
jgi:hypothetical protein